jgi:Zinc carboxypeptidase
MRRVAALLPLAAVALLLSAGVAPAASLTVRVAGAVPRDCASARPGAAGTRDLRLPVGHAGVATVRLDGPADADWDLAALDARGRKVAASTSFGVRERLIAWASPGRPLRLRVCRRAGSGASARLHVRLDRPGRAARVATGDPVALARVTLTGPADVRRLLRSGLDVTHDAGVPSATVLVSGAGDRARLHATGLTWRTVTPDLAAADARSRLAGRRRARAAAATLPSGRSSYRTLDDYTSELRAIAEGHGAISRALTLPLASLEGRPIEGVELAHRAGRPDDGRPVFVLLGLVHAREWPAGELVMEWARELAERDGTDPRVTALLERVRVVVVPVANPDGFVVSRTAGTAPTDDDPNATLAQTLGDQAAYKRKNCRATVAGAGAQPCALRTGSGVDLNRNAGAWWGGPGSSGEGSVQDYRGAGPFSEPESDALRRLTAALPVTTLVTVHTYTSDGKWLRQPGFDDLVATTPDEQRLRLLGDAMAAATGWTSELGYQTLGDITGATEDWNYFAQGTFGYTAEVRGRNFHGSYAASVTDEYLGTGAQAGRGAREAFFLAAEHAADRRDHALLEGTAPPGSTLRLDKRFLTATSQPGLDVHDHLTGQLTVPASGAFTWDVNPSVRPLGPRREAWSLACSDRAGRLRERRDVVVRRGERVALRLDCVRATLAIVAGDVRRATPHVRLRAAGGTLRDVRVRLTRGGRTLASARRPSLRGERVLRLRRRGRLPAGRVTLVVRAVDPAGRALRRSARARVR